MHERARLRRESVRYAVLFFVLFGLVFAALGVFVFRTVSTNIYRTVDNELLESGSLLARGGESDGSVALSSKEEDASTEGEAFEDGELALSQSVMANPQIIYLTRGSDGAVVDTVGIYTQYAEALKSLPFDAALEGEVYQFDRDGHRYRAVTYRLDPARDGAAYVQAVANVDSEVAILDRFTATLAGALAVALVVSAGLSYLLSRMTLRPIAEAWESQTEFVQNASHELRTPLAVIRTNQELLLDEPMARIVDKFAPINVTIEEVGRLTRLTDDLLTLTASDAHPLEFAVERLDLGELVGGVASSYEELALAQGKAFEVVSQADVWVRGSRDRLMQLAAILLDNALKYTGEGDAVRVDVGKRGSSATIAVSDTGIGIEDVDVGRVFDRFYRADKARSRSTGGSGLGLSIAKSIVDAHGGTIRMERVEPHGVSVTATLPGIA